jgi:hypothetical protein
VEHLNTTRCECGHTFTAKDIKPPLIKVNDHRMFGGNVKRQSAAQCPGCEKTYLLWLKPEHNTYTVKTISLHEPKKVYTGEIPPVDDRDAIIEYLKRYEIKYHPNTSTEKLYDKVIEHSQGA